MRKDLQDLWLLAEPYVRDAGFDLIEVQFGREQRGMVLRLFIDRPFDGNPGRVSGPSRDDSAGQSPAPSTRLEGGSEGINVDDCERVSRDVSAALDVADKIPQAYQLEVSSPGLDRPLRRERDFARFAGESARIRLTEGVEGRRNFTGTIRAAKDGRVEIACDGRSYEIPIDDITRANLIPDWNREFQKGAKEDRVGEGERRSPEPVAGGAGPSQGPEHKWSAS